MILDERIDKEARELTQKFSAYAIARMFLQQCVEGDNQREEEKVITLDGFDTKLKTLLKQAGKNGIDVKYISVENIDVSTNAEECYILQDYRVEYSRGGR